MAQVYMGDVSGPDSVPQLMDRARSAAHRALELDSRIPESHVALANLDLYYYWNFAEAEEEARRAVAIDPNSPRALQASCAIKITLKRTQEGLADCRRAVEVDPLRPSPTYILGVPLILHAGTERQLKKRIRHSKSNRNLRRRSEHLGWRTR